MPQPKGRPPREDRSNVVGELLSLRLTPNERALLEKIMEVRALQVAEAGGATLSLNSVLRSMIHREAKALGLLENEAPTKPTSKKSTAKSTRPRRQSP